MRLTRRGPGDYFAGSWEVIKDPTSGDMSGGWGYTSWILYLHPHADSEGGAFAVEPTLGDARDFIISETHPRIH